jgi:membrane-bound serine protease (ClpP class)
MIGVLGQVTDCNEDGYHAHIHGERWRIRSAMPISPGDSVRVTALDGLVLVVEPTTESEQRRTA